MLVRVLNLGLSVALARALGPVLQGQLMLLLVFLGLAYSLGNLGLDAAAIYFLGKKKWDLPDFLHVLIPLLTISGLILLAVVSLILLFYPATFESLDTISIALFFCLIPLELFSIALRYILIAREDFKSFNTVEAIQSISLVLLVVAALWIESASIHWVMSAYVANRIGIVAWLMRRIPVLTFKFDLEKSRHVLAFSLKPWLTNMFSLMNVRLDAVMVGWFAGIGLGVEPRDIGFYTICILAVSRLRDVQSAIQTTFFPRISNLDDQEASHLTAQVYRQSFLVYVGIFGAVLVFGYPVLALYGAEYVSAFPTLLLLTLAVVLVRANSGVLSIYFTSLGNPKVPLWINGVGTGINLALNILLIPNLGILGAALATVLSAATVKLLLIAAFCKATHLNYSEHLFLRKSDFHTAWKIVRTRGKSTA